MTSLNALARRFVREEEGALVTEYGMLIVIVVLGMAAVLVAFRTQVSTWFATIGTNLQSLS
jgi:pilus assembly protein Flp/PilA